MKKKLFFPLALLFGIAVSAFSDGQDPLRKSYAETITANDLKTHLSVIASDAYEGRETGKKGQKMAADYIAAQFKAFGIPVLPSGSYFQDVPLIQLEPGNANVIFEKDTFLFKNDFYFSGNVEDGKSVFQNLIFAGYGIQDSLYKDYDGLDVKGKVVMVLADEPVLKNGNSLISGKKELSDWSTNRRRKNNEAKKRGAALLLIVENDYQQRFEQNKRFILKPALQVDDPAKVKEPAGMSTFYISKEMADRLLKKSKKTSAKLSAQIAKKKKPIHLEVNGPLTTNIQRKTEKLHSENVLGYLEGSDLKNELVVVTAHYDHLGKDGDMIFNGADDDGSGTVAVLEMAEAFAKAKKEGHGPRRSMLFMTVTGEEKGLLGSKWYTDHPVFPLANTVCDLNIDMIGRIDEAHKDDTAYVYVIGSDKLSSELKRINESNNATYTQLKLDYRFDVPNEPNNFYMRSDHYNFAKNDIPIAFFFNGTHADYHKETDEVSKINFALMERRARLVFYDAWEIANRDKRLPLDEKK